MQPQKLKHNYFIVRHGFSIPNEKHIIVSTLENGIKPEFGLARKGKQDVEQKAESMLAFILESQQQNQDANIEIEIITSPFSRTVETAQIIRNVFSSAKNNNKVSVSPSSEGRVRTDERLRERNFGKLELESDENYQKVWAEDLSGVNESSYDAESLESVWNRVQSLVFDLEKENKTQKSFVLVAHGDVLQITQTGWQVSLGNMKRLNDHRSLPHMHQAEIRKL